MTSGPVAPLDQDRAVRDLVAEAAPVHVSLAGRLALYFHTVRHLRPGQIAWQVRRRLFPPRPPAGGPPVAWRDGVRFALFLPAPEPAGFPGRIAFVGQSRPFRLASPDWVAGDAPKLWRYNLHYFDFLSWPGVNPADKAALIDDWIARVTVGAVDAWEPYPISLRVVNWLKHGLTLPANGVPAQWVASLSHQAAALEGDVEYHLRANHLLKNGKALVFAGICLDGPAAQRWLARGLDIVLAEAAEQFLPDGGHIERSPMYHCIALEDVVDLVGLIERNAGLVADADLRILRDAARRGTAFLRAIRNGSGEIPLFNDAAFGITRPAADVLAHADRSVGAPVGAPSGATSIVVAPEGAPTGAPTRIFLPDTGYYGYRQGGDSLIVDGGPVGPDYQPGHAHCDTLSYELQVGGAPIVVDSGTYDYEPGPLRQYLRSTAAHNTVRIDGQEQSGIWGQFRVGRRARPWAVVLGAWQDDRLVFEGEHDGYCRLPGRPVHRREIVMEARGRWSVRDRLLGTGTHRVESFLHFHPAVRLDRVTDREFHIAAPDGVELRLAFGPAGTLQRATSYYCPRFGERLASGALVLEHTGPLPVELTYVFERL